MWLAFLHNISTHLRTSIFYLSGARYISVFRLQTGAAVEGACSGLRCRPDFYGALSVA